MQEKKEALDLLFRKIFGGRATKKEQEQADRWFNQLDVYGAPYFKDRQQEEQIRIKMQQNLTQLIYPKTSRRWKTALWLPYAAAVLLLLACFTGLYYYKQAKPETFFIRTAENRKQLTLPDGTTVFLNKHSSLSWDSRFNQKDRKINLSGEAFFEVKSDKKRVFSLLSGHIKTIVTGTAFNVEAYPDEKRISVALLRGHVRIENIKNKAQHAALNPGQMMIYHPEKGNLEVKNMTVPDPSAWIKGEMIFNDIPLPLALDRLEKHYHLIILDPGRKTNGKTISASIANVAWPEALNSILFTHNLHYSTNKKGEIIID